MITNVKDFEVIAELHTTSNVVAVDNKSSEDIIVASNKHISFQETSFAKLEFLDRETISRNFTATPSLEEEDVNLPSKGNGNNSRLLPSFSFWTPLIDEDNEILSNDLIVAKSQVNTERKLATTPSNYTKNADTFKPENYEATVSDSSNYDDFLFCHENINSQENIISSIDCDYDDILSQENISFQLPSLSLLHSPFQYITSPDEQKLRLMDAESDISSLNCNSSLSSRSTFLRSSERKKSCSRIKYVPISSSSSYSPSACKTLTPSKCNVIIPNSIKFTPVISRKLNFYQDH